MATTWTPEQNGNTGRMIFVDNEVIYVDSENYYVDGSDVLDKTQLIVYYCLADGTYEADGQTLAGDNVFYGPAGYEKEYPVTGGDSTFVKESY